MNVARPNEGAYQTSHDDDEYAEASRQADKYAFANSSDFEDYLNCRFYFMGRYYACKQLKACVETMTVLDSFVAQFGLSSELQTVQFEVERAQEKAAAEHTAACDRFERFT
jgi:hypothetical protein